MWTIIKPWNDHTTKQPVSVPNAIRALPVETATALPPELPPGTQIPFSYRKGEINYTRWFVVEKKKTKCKLTYLQTTKSWGCLESRCRKKKGGGRGVCRGGAYTRMLVATLNKQENNCVKYAIVIKLPVGGIYLKNIKQQVMLRLF